MNKEQATTLAAKTRSEAVFRPTKVGRAYLSESTREIPPKIILLMSPKVTASEADSAKGYIVEGYGIGGDRPHRRSFDWQPRHYPRILCHQRRRHLWQCMGQHRTLLVFESRRQSIWHRTPAPPSSYLSALKRPPAFILLPQVSKSDPAFLCDLGEHSYTACSHPRQLFVVVYCKVRLASEFPPQRTAVKAYQVKLSPKTVRGKPFWGPG